MEDLGSVSSRGGGHGEVERGNEATLLSHSGEGILINNHRSKIKEEDLGKLKYFYKIPKSVEN